MQKDYESAVPRIIKVQKPQREDIWTMRFLIICAAACLIIFVVWFFDPTHIGYSLIYWPLTFALVFKLFKMLHEWYHYWHLSIPEKPILKTQFSVDVLTTACPGEPHEMIIRTLKAMKSIKYPHRNYLCDEGDDPLLREACREIGIIHVTRIEKMNAKAGNINNALRQATGDICVVLDPDHVPVPEFLDSVLPYFEDPAIAYVQCVQAYGNQSESFIAKAVAEQSYHFYGPMMMCMNSYGTVQAIGANCTFRRSALDSIGGHAAGLAEDMHTAMQLQAKGWKSVYIPEILTRGLVPATLSSYYKQQLKWARGCFELLFRVYPSLFKSFTWRQKFHHFAMPLFFLFGLINFIDILIPILALSFAQVPWELDVGNFVLIFLSLCGLSMLIRLYAQRWLLEDHERGFHIAGGMLRIATWWIYLVGFIYSIFNVKVPYIPTPKEDAHENHWKLSIPNMVIVSVSVLSIVYGLSIDWTPYSLAMSFYAGINVFILGFIILVSQQKFLLNLKQTVHTTPLLESIVSPVEFIGSGIQKAAYGIFRHARLSVVLGVALLFVSYNNSHNSEVHPQVVKEKEFGGFYSGISFSENEENIKSLSALEHSLDRSFDIITITQNWNESAESLPERSMKEIKAHGAIPMINWKSGDIDQEKVYASIYEGKQDAYLEKCADILRKYREPVFINFNPGFDAQENSSLNTSKEFIHAWQYLYTFFNDLGVSNVTWVWNPKHSSSFSYYPGSKFVDWIGVSCLNYGKQVKDTDWYSFSELYSPFRNSLGDLEKPIMITEFGTAAGDEQSAWMGNALNVIQEKFKEIRSVVMKTDQTKITFRDKTTNDSSVYLADFGWKSEVIEILASRFKEAPFNKKPFMNKRFENLDKESEKYRSDFVIGDPGKFQLMIKGEPYYIRGIAYNTAHDWRDGNMPLTRRRLEKDFERIKEMGANTIRRYDDGIYDKNVLNIANEYDLKVLFGFWFDPKVDYYKDTLKVKEYLMNVEEKVLAYKDHSAILAWSLGNETWGLLKHNYSKPYLTKVRNQYIKFIELLAQRIHEIDPERPVFSCMEHEIYQLPGEIAAFHDGAPSIDVIGVNSYYEEQISQLNHCTYEFDSLRPYLVSEFGPKGYWDPSYNRTSQGLLIEDSETEKAEWYKKQWTKYVAAYKGSNIGGFAYCWHDRMEGSYTWFGLTDYKGRTKPSYYALKELWTSKITDVIPDFYIEAPAKLKPGGEYKFKAVSSAAKNNEFNYEWYLYKDEYVEKVNTTELSDDASSVSVKIPKQISDYRLYLYVSDDKGNVTTASCPIQVK